ncbi:hypothetical protein AB0H71_16665 [Nocardia sp. NPDC050697]|uniref:2'-5' RNA ligase family protein n=1 Tax=Nocardia sp. NPDC050697 TaxID=3155158 RepID=UPI0033E1C944
MVVPRMGSAGGRKDRTGALGYYWFLTFEQVPDLHAVTGSSQQDLDTANFALTPAAGLHLTLDRIARLGTSQEQLEAIVASAERMCRDLIPFALTIDRTIDLHGALAFIVTPEERVMGLRDVLRTATLSVLPDAPVKESSSPPHVTVAYPGFEGLDVRVGRAERVVVPVTEAVLVALERRDFSYRWDVVARIGLGSGAVQVV